MSLLFETLLLLQVERVDGFLSDKLEELEKTYPGLTKPTEALVADVKDVYDKNIKVALDHTKEGIRKYGADQVRPEAALINTD